MDPSSDEIAALAERLSTLAKTVAGTSDPLTKKAQARALVMEAKQVICQVQDPVEAIVDQGVNLITIGSIKALLSIGVFDAIPPNGSATVEAIAEKCDADEAFIIRLMRQLVCVGIFTEVKANEWAHNRLSILLSSHFGKVGQYMFSTVQDEMGPAIYNLRGYTKEFGRGDILTYTHTPHSWSHNMSDKTFWEVLGSDPARLDIFNRTLAAFETAYPVAVLFPFEKILQEGHSANRPALVDIGGGRGQALLDFRKHIPSLKGELILQERKGVLDSISEEDLPGITKMAHDFFTEQPVKNAQVYFIRRVLHDWVDKEAAQILQSIKPAMGEDSRIIVSDTSLPELVSIKDAGAVWMDVMMMTIGGKERAPSDWAKLAELSGLRLVHIWKEPEKYGPLAMVEYMLPEDAH